MLMNKPSTLINYTSVRARIIKHNEKYQKAANKHRKPAPFEEGDLVWVHLRKVRFLQSRHGTLKRIADGPFKVLRGLETMPIRSSCMVTTMFYSNAFCALSASDIPVLKEVEAVTEPALFNVVRFIVSAIPFPPFVLKGCGDRHTRTAGVELGLWVSFGYVSQALGLLTSEAGRASFISTFTVIVVPLMDGMLGAAVPALTWCGAIVSLLGVAMLECVGSPPCVGDVLNILSAVFFGIHMLRTEQISRSTKKDNFLALLGFEVCVVALSSVVWFLIKDIFNDVHQLSFASCSLSKLWDFMTSFPWIPALYTGVFSTGLCLWAEMYAMGDVSATETAIIYGMEPLWGASFAWFLLDERWDTTTWIGAALVLCGSLTVQILDQLK
uniref:EamA domain-containing protein n=1 Tax=Ananas comosus var. bracteatus TaxID=296719 RepID=A0A6V7PPE0_ANACO|nr:unnamed protein product [Ananas comosus var. bracteatus]